MNRTLEEIMYISDGVNPFKLNNLSGGLGYKPTIYNIKGNGLDDSGEYKKIPKTKLENSTVEELEELLNSTISDINMFERGEFGLIGEDIKENEIINSLNNEKDEIITQIEEIQDKEKYSKERNDLRDLYIKEFQKEEIPFYHKWISPKNTSDKLLDDIINFYDREMDKKENIINNIIYISGDDDQIKDLKDLPINILEKILYLSNKVDKSGEHKDNYYIDDLIKLSKNELNAFNKLYEENFKHLKKAQNITEEFNEEINQRDEYLTNIEKPNIDISQFENEEIKNKAIELVNTYKELFDEYNDKNYFIGNYENRKEYFGGAGNDNFEISYIPLKNVNGIVIMYNNGELEEIIYKEEYKEPFLKDCFHLSSLLYSLDNETWNKLISNNAVVKLYVNTDVNTYQIKNGKKELIYEKSTFNIYDNFVKIQYTENGVDKYEDYTIENKHYQNTTGKLKNNYIYKNILETNEAVDLLYLKDIKNNSIIEKKNLIKELNLDFELSNDNAEKKMIRLKEQKIQSEINDILNRNSPIKRTVNLTMTKTGIILNADFLHLDSYGTEEQYKKVKKDYSALIVPKFSKNGTIEDFVNKKGVKIDAKYNNLLLGSKLLINMTLIDREIGINYSKLIKENKIIPSNILKTQPLTYDKVKKSYSAIGFFENQVKIIKNAPVKIKKNKSIYK